MSCFCGLKIPENRRLQRKYRKEKGKSTLMLKQLLLTLILATGLVLPVVADTTPITTESNNCDFSKLGAFSGAVELEAIWVPDLIKKCDAGKYFDVNNIAYDDNGDFVCEICPAGSYCSGFENIDFNGENHGINSCSEITDGNESGITWTSDAGADSQDACYHLQTFNCSERNPYTHGHETGVVYVKDSSTGEENTICKMYHDGSESCSNACEIEELFCGTGYRPGMPDGGDLQCVAYGVRCAAGTYLPQNETECVPCLEDNYCPGTAEDTVFDISDTSDQGMIACESGLFAPVGARYESDCGHKLHIGNNVLHMHTDKRTEHALVVKVGDITYYADATAVAETSEPITINPNNPAVKETLRVDLDGAEYYIHETIYE